MCEVGDANDAVAFERAKTVPPRATPCLSFADFWREKENDMPLITWAHMRGKEDVSGERPVSPASTNANPISNLTAIEGWIK